jgi:glycosyltransferase involved in cell wall biosynthesis
MKIVHIAEAFAGGVPVFIKSLVDNMPDEEHIIIHGNREKIANAQTVKSQFSQNNVSFIHWASAQRSINLYKDAVAFAQLCNYLKRLNEEKKIDVVHLHSSKSGFLGRIACFALSIKNVVYTPNGAPFLVGKNNVSNFLYKLLEKLGSKFGGQIVSCSPSEHIAYKKVGLRTITINNGIDTKKKMQIQARTNGEESKKIFRIVTSGRISHQKNPELFNSIAEYFKDFKFFEFAWIGDGEMKHKLASPNINITGWLPAEEANMLISKGDLYLSTANFEGLSFSVLEALNFKKPVLLTDCVGNKDLVDRSLNGDLFINKADATIKILQYYNNKPMLSMMGKHSSLHCNEFFSARLTSEKYYQLYRSKTNFAHQE